jgi:hypothetical protein
VNRTGGSLSEEEDHIMDENKSDLEKNIFQYAKYVGLTFIVISFIIIGYVFGDAVKAFLIWISIVLLSFGLTLVVGKPIKDYIFETTVLLSLAIYGLWKKYNDGRKP